MRTSSERGCDLIVVSDTSPIRALDHLGLLPLLSKMFGTVIIPPAVALELAQPRARFRPIRAEEIAGVQITEPRDHSQVVQLQQELDTGEAEAIVLAMELHADVLLIDELEGRRVAAQRGLTTTGVVGVLIRAKAKGLIPALVPLAIRLRDELGFHLSDAVITEVKRLAGEP